MSGHTPGPWQWEVTPGGEIRLVTPDRGRLYVMGFARKGMRGAQPRFSLWGEGERERRGGIMHDFVEAGGPDHPDARLIAAAPELLEALVGLLRTHEDPDRLMCCNGRECGCMGATVYGEAEHYARAAIAKATGGAA